MFVQHNRLLAFSGFGLLLLLGLFLGRQWVAHAQTNPPVHPDGWDLSFGGTGILQTGCASPYNSSDYEYTGKIKVLPDGKVLVVAFCDGFNTLLRYRPDGTPDPSFGNNGRVHLLGWEFDVSEGSPVVQQNGNIIVLLDGHLQRYLPDGSLDLTFGNLGTITDTNFDEVMIDSDDRIIIKAFGDENLDVLIRYTANGMLDTTFNGSGSLSIKTLPLPKPTDDTEVQLSSSFVQSDNKLLLWVSMDWQVDPFDPKWYSQWLLVRLNTDGTIDRSFATDGIFMEQDTDAMARNRNVCWGWSFGVATQPDGKILVATSGTIIRLNPDGEIDSTFQTTVACMTDVAIDAQGYIIFSDYNTIYRLSPTGQLDEMRITAIEPINHFALQNDGSIIVSAGWIDGLELARNIKTQTYPTAVPPTPTIELTPTPSPTPTPLPPAQRSLALVYAVLDNNLGSEWTRLVNNIEAGAHPGVDVRLLIDGPAIGDAYVYQIQSDRNPYCPTIENPTCDGRYSEGYNYQRFFTEDTARPHALYQFLVDSFNAYPQAPQISLTIIGHGSGWGANALPAQPSIWRDQNDTLGGMLWDDHTGVQAGSRSLSTLALGQAIHWATSETNRTLNLLYLDGCSMGMTEVAYELRNRADYLLASPNTDWATFAYDQLLPLVRYDRDGRALGEAWLAAEAALMRSRTGYPFTLALTDLRQITPLATTVTAFADALQGVIPTQRAALTLAYQQSDRFESNYDATLDSNDNYLDLRDFAAQVQSSITDTLVISHAQAVQTLLSSVVITVAQQSGSPWLAEEQTWAWRNLGGLSIYAPLHQDEAKRRIYYTKENLAWAADSTWDEFITTFWDSDGAGNATAAILTSELPVCFATTQNCVGLANQLPVQPPQSIFLPIASKFGDQP